jgi:hypothetical protein
MPNSTATAHAAHPEYHCALSLAVTAGHLWKAAAVTSGYQVDRL